MCTISIRKISPYLNGIDKAKMHFTVSKKGKTPRILILLLKFRSYPRPEAFLGVALIK